MSKAIGVLETRGMASLLGATDAMLKAADVRVIGRHGIGSGWVTIVIEGDVAAVQTAIGVGRAQAQRHGELIVAEVVARPEARAQAAMPHRSASVVAEVDNRALGLLETQGLAPLIAGADAMAKAADVEICGWASIGGALCHVLVRGDVAAVQTAIETGRRAAEKVGTVYATLVLPQPLDGVAQLLPPAPEAEGMRTGALGVVEAIGYAAIVAAGDAMVKAAEVDIQRLSIGSGGRIAALAIGSLDDVQVAVQAGREVVGQVGELDGVVLVSRPDAATMACFAGAVDDLLPGGARRAMGLIETRSTVALVRAVDQMLKSADVEYEGSYKVGYFLTASIVRGDVGAVRVAIEAGAQEVAKHGELVAAHVIPQLYEEVERRLPHQ
ncbi:MAG: microcompartment protein CcmL/EutN [Candidatus Latescibacterota bacterium]